MSNDFEFEMDPRMAMQLREMDITGLAHSPTLLHPSLVQYEIKPGQQAVMVTTNNELDDDFTLLTVLDPSDYLTQFPDGKARWERNWRLCEWHSNDDPEGDIGWFQLGRIIPLERQDQYDDLFKAAVLGDNKDLDGAPQWLHDIYADYLEGLNQVDPGQVFIPVECGECGSKKVELHMRKTALAAVPVGYKEKTLPNGDKRIEYGMIRSPQTTGTFEAHLHCQDCEHRGVFSEEEVQELDFEKMFNQPTL